MNTRNTKLHRNQTGLVSIIITVVMMMVISLVVISYAKIIRREQRQTLDRQLSTQAFFVAESGINQAIKAIKDDGFKTDKTDCNPIAGNARLDDVSDYELDANSKITCLLIDNAPETLQYSSVSSESKVIPISSKSGANLSSVTLTWRNKNQVAPAAFGCSSPNFPPATAGGWGCSVGILRVDLVNTNGVLTRAALNNNMFSAFFYPTTGGSNSVAYATAGGIYNQGQVVNTNCTGNPAVCTMTITGLSSPSYHMRVRSIYLDSSLAIEGESSGTAVELKDAQSVIDVTGKANDVLRRVQVSICTNRLCTVNKPDYVLQTTDVCKRYLMDDTSITSDQPITGNPAYPCNIE